MPTCHIDGDGFFGHCPECGASEKLHPTGPCFAEECDVSSQPGAQWETWGEEPYPGECMGWRHTRPESCAAYRRLPQKL